MTKRVIQRLCACGIALSMLSSCLSISWGNVSATASVRKQQDVKVFTSERALQASDKLSISASLDAKIILSSETKVVVMSSSEERLMDLAIERKGDVISLHDELIKTLRKSSLKNPMSVERLAIDIYIPSLSQIEVMDESIVEMPERMTCDSLSINLSGASLLKALSVSAKRLAISSSGACDVEGKDLQVEALVLRCSGSSESKLQGTFDQADLDLSGASSSSLSGVCRQIRLDLSGSSDAKCRTLSCQEAEIKLSGASDAEIRVHERLRYSISGSSDLHVWGKPHIEQAKSSGASSFSIKEDREQE